MRAIARSAALCLAVGLAGIAAGGGAGSGGRLGLTAGDTPRAAGNEGPARLAARAGAAAGSPAGGNGERATLAARVGLAAGSAAGWGGGESGAAARVAAQRDAASDTDKVRGVLLEMSSALEENNAARFLDQVDHRRCPDYAALEDNVVAMMAQDDVGSSVGVIEQAKKGDGYELKLDWLLELKPSGGGAAAERRHATVTCRIEPSGKRWKVTLLAPVSFFKPLSGDAR